MYFIMIPTYNVGERGYLCYKTQLLQELVMLR
nr:MAG TPA: hypothetical protein [Caudoviricetes sp.]